MKFKNVIIDGPYLAHRSHSAPYNLTTSNGLDSTLIHGFLRKLLSLYKTHSLPPSLEDPSPHHPNIIITWESHGTHSWRRQQLPTYKPSSLTPEPNYISQVTDLKAILNHLNITQYFSPNNEADDVIASFTTNNPHPTLIFTTDKDIHQIISDSRKHYILNKDDIICEADVLSKFGVLPLQIPDYLALVGDKSDNIPGVDGIGPVKASKLLSEYQTISNIPCTVFKHSTDHIIATNNKKLTLLNKRCSYQPVETPRNPSLIQLLEKYELYKIIENLISYKRISRLEPIQ